MADVRVGHDATRLGAARAVVAAVEPAGPVRPGPLALTRGGGNITAHVTAPGPEVLALLRASGA